MKVEDMMIKSHYTADNMITSRVIVVLKNDYFSYNYFMRNKGKK
jgi:hypothetical protein